jgi:putative tricarboxylic transport membrane protein
VVLQYHGVNFGPQLFVERPEIGFGMFMAMAVTYLMMIFTVLPLSRYMSKVTVVSTAFMAPVIISFTLVGSFVPREFVFDMGLSLVFGVIGYIARKTHYHVAAILIGIILGPLLEQFFLRAVRMANGDLTVLFSSNLGNALWLALAVSIALPYWLDHRRDRQHRKSAGEAPPEG